MNPDPKTCPHCARMRAQLAEKDIEIQSLQAGIEELRRHDPLTGVLNRRSLLQTLDAELQRANRTGHPFCFVIMDIDCLRDVNIKYGLPAGDAVLKNVADTSMKLLRALDSFGRLGSEEFGIVLPATWMDQAVIAMGRLSKAVAESDRQSIAPDLALTFSAGLTTNAFGDTAESMIKRAEKALVQAKSEGGNRTILAEEPLPIAPPVDL